jgi:long-chain acyl-CoA synthetase
LSTMADESTAKLLSSLPNRISEILTPWADSTPNHPALVDGTNTWSFAELRTIVHDTSSFLRQNGVRPGDRVMLVAENSTAYIAFLLATSALDAWPVLVNARLAPHEVDRIQKHSGARLTIYTTAISPLAARHAKRHGAEIRALDRLGTVGVGTLNDQVEPEPVHSDGKDQVGALIYTSGTTGMPKGVMLSQRNLLFMAAVSATVRGLSPSDRLYGILPMSHAVGLSVVLLGSLWSGATLYVTSRFDPVAALQSLEKDRLTIVLGVPGMFALLVEYAKSQGVERLNFPELRVISSSGAPLDLTVKAKTEELFKMPLNNGYGVTECSPTIAQARIDRPQKQGSVGRVLPGVEIKLVGSDGSDAKPGEVGELWVRGPNVMLGYYRAPEETTAAINGEGWFNTRDLAKIEDGDMFIVGRTKDLIVHSGFNVYPAEVEAVLNSHPSVVRSAVVGLTVNGDEQVVAFVELPPDRDVTTSDLAKFAAQHLASYKQPSKIFIVPSMPLTPTGKVIKDRLVEALSLKPPL